MSDVSSATNTQNVLWHDAVARDQVDRDFTLAVDINGHKLGLFLLNDEVHALEDVCPHAYALL